MANSTSETNANVALRLLDAMRAGNADALADLLTDDFINHNPTASNGLKSTQALLAAVGPIETTVHRVIAEDNLVVTHAHFVYTHPATKEVIDSAAIDIWKIKDGKIAEHWDVIQPRPATTTSGQDMFSELTA
jgi:predicted SnoaL-like aldol condensation-catalyzing enzyme